MQTAPQDNSTTNSEENKITRRDSYHKLSDGSSIKIEKESSTKHEKERATKSRSNSISGKGDQDNDKKDSDKTKPIKIVNESKSSRVRSSRHGSKSSRHHSQSHDITDEIETMNARNKNRDDDKCAQKKSSSKSSIGENVNNISDPKVSESKNISSTDLQLKPDEIISSKKDTLNSESICEEQIYD